MMQVFTALLIFLHQLATVVWIGQLVIGNVVFMPLFASQLERPARARMLAGMAKRFTPLFWGSVVIFNLTGIPMLIGGMDQVGIADPWSVLVLAKHAVVILMIVLGALTLGATTKACAEETPPADSQAAGKRARLMGVVSMICGLVVLLLTALAEAL
ncbi:MAG: CopD family protein [Anaerolineae bacterium]|jgi:uncharacterized membrane protein